VETDPSATRPQCYRAEPTTALPEAFKPSTVQKAINSVPGLARPLSFSRRRRRRRKLLQEFRELGVHIHHEHFKLWIS
jgi:hypothetical protein